MVCIRSVNIDDLEQLYKIEQRCFPQAEAASKEVLLQRLERFSSHFFLLEEQGRPVGMVNGMVTHSSVITDSMYVMPVFTRKRVNGRPFLVLTCCRNIVAGDMEDS